MVVASWALHVPGSCVCVCACVCVCVRVNTQLTLVLCESCVPSPDTTQESNQLVPLSMAVQYTASGTGLDYTVPMDTVVQ